MRNPRPSDHRLCTGKRGLPDGNTGKRWHSWPMPRAQDEDPARRFLTLTDVAEILSTSVAQVRALVQSGELRYIQIGGRQQYRVETVELEKYIQRKYAESDAKARRDAATDDVPG
jgi:excisionase family DNA binding protein